MTNPLAQNPEEDKAYLDQINAIPQTPPAPPENPLAGRPPAQAREVPPPATPAPAQPDHETEIPGYDGRWTRARIRELKALEDQGTSEKSIVDYSRAIGDRSLDAVETPEERRVAGSNEERAYINASNRLAFRRWAEESGYAEAFTQGSAGDQKKILDQWADGIYGPQAQRDRKGADTGRVRRDPRAVALANSLAGEGRLGYWTFAIPDEHELDTAVARAAQKAGGRAPGAGAANPLATQPQAPAAPAPTPQASVVRRAGDVAVEGVAGLARGALGIADLANRGLQMLGIGADQKNVEAAYAILNKVKELGQSDAYIAESRAFSEALGKVDASVIAEMGRALVRGDNARAEELATASGIGDAWKKAGATVVAGVILGGAAEFLLPGGVGAKAAGALTKGATLAKGAGALAGMTLAPSASQATEVGAEVRRTTGNDAAADKAGALASPGGAAIIVGNALGAAIGPGGQVARVAGVPTIAKALDPVGRTARAAAAAAAGAAQGAITTEGQNLQREGTGVERQNVSGPTIVGGVLGGVLGAVGSRPRAEPSRPSGDVPLSPTVEPPKDSLLALPPPDGTPRFEGSGDPVITPPPPKDSGNRGAENDPRAAQPGVPEARVAPDDGVPARVVEPEAPPPRNPLETPASELGMTARELVADAMARRDEAEAADAARLQQMQFREDRFPLEESTRFGDNAARERERAATRDQEYTLAEQQRGEEARKRALEDGNTNLDAEAVMSRRAKATGDRPADIYDRRGERPATPISAEDAARTINTFGDIVRRNDTAIEVYHSRAAMPPEIQKVFTPDTKATIVRGTDGKPTIVIDRSMHADSADLIKTLNHEVISHISLPKVLGFENFGRLLDDVAAARSSDPAINRLYQEISKLYPGADPKKLAEEVLARINETGSLGDTTRGVLDRMGEMLQKVGITDNGAQVKPEQLTSILGSVKGAQSNVEAAARLRENLAPAGHAGIRQTFERTEHGFREETKRKIDWMSFLFNELAGIKAVAQALRQSGTLNRLFEHATLASTRAQSAMDRTTAMHVRPMQEKLAALAQQHGRTIDQMSAAFDSVAAVRHGPERNEKTWLRHVPLTNEIAEGKRADLFVDFAEGRHPGGKDLDAALARIVKDSTAKIKREDWKGVGATDAELAQLARVVEASPHMKALNDEFYGLYRALQDETTRRAVETGDITQRQIDFYGFDHYVPAKGGTGDVNLLVKRTVGDSLYVPKKQALGRGDQGIPTNTLGETMAMAVDSARQVGAAPFMTELGRVIGLNPERFGVVVENERARVRSSDGKRQVEFDMPVGLDRKNYENVVRFIDEATGEIKHAVLLDDSLKGAVRRMVDGPEARGGIARGLQAATSFVSQGLTSKNPWFWSTQFTRDWIGNTMRLFTDGEAFGLDFAQSAKAPVLFQKHMTSAMLPGSNAAKFASMHGDSAKQQAFLDSIRKSDPDFVDFADNAMIRFHSQFAGLEGGDYGLARHNPLAEPSTISKLWTRAGQIQERLEIAHRYGFYKTLKELGVDSTKAAYETVELTNFNQRSGVSRLLSPLYAFSNTIGAAGDRALNRSIWRNGEVPWTNEVLPTGQTRQYITADAILQNLNYRRLGAMTVLGYAMASAAGGLLAGDRDENGLSPMDKVSPEALTRSFFFPSGNKGELMRLSIPDTEAMLPLALGQLLFAAQSGNATGSDVGIAMANTILRVFGPALKPRGEISSDPRGSVGADLLAGAVPTLAQPIFQNTMNRTFMGTPLDNRGQMRSGAGGLYSVPRGPEASRDSLPPVYREIAEEIRNMTGGTGKGLSVSGEEVRNLLGTLFAPIMRPVDAYISTEARNKQGGEPQDPVGRVFRDLFVKAENSPRSYYFREHAQARAPLEDLRAQYEAAIKKDRDGGDATKSKVRNDAGRLVYRWSVGPAQAAFMEQNPVAHEYLQHALRQSAENRKGSNEQGSPVQQQRTLRATGTPEQVEGANRDRDAKLHRETVKFQNMWKAHAAWQAAGSVPSQWAKIRAQFPDPTD